MNNLIQFAKPWLAQGASDTVWRARDLHPLNDSHRFSKTHEWQANKTSYSMKNEVTQQLFGFVGELLIFLCEHSFPTRFLRKPSFPIKPARWNKLRKITIFTKNKQRQISRDFTSAHGLHVGIASGAPRQLEQNL